MDVLNSVLLIGEQMANLVTISQPVRKKVLALPSVRL